MSKSKSPKEYESQAHPMRTPGWIREQPRPIRKREVLKRMIDQARQKSR
jgi:hypothetical protein